MKILAIECSDAPVSCAVTEDGHILCEQYRSVGLTHSQTLMPMVERVLGDCGLTANDIDRFAVTCGPGSFTGLRIGIAAVKGLALGADKPCVPVSTLNAIAYCAAGAKGIICAVMDARCNQVYNALFYSDGITLERLCGDRALMIDELETDLLRMRDDDLYKNEPIILAGHGSELCYNRFNKKVPDLRQTPIGVRYQRASGVALIAENCSTVSAAGLLPTYLRLPQAERELKAKQEAKQEKDGVK